jgi:serine/threonine protein kinase
VPNPTAGTELGPYRVEGFLGAGSMGDVFRGVDSSLGRRVAIKLLADKHRDSAELRARFTREGRAVAMVSHPNVVQVFTTGTYDARPYIAMEFLDGTDLGTMVDGQGPMGSLDAARAMLDAAAGLAAAAAAGLIHRDVKPSNQVKLTTGSVKVTDFGLAKPVDPGSEPALTALGVVVGTPDYIAPEQARGEPIDERVDIYALGGTLYFLLTGKPPFRTGVPAEDKYLKVVARHLRQPPPDAREKQPGVDPELAELARLMMSKKPAERPRYPELLERLATIADRLGGGDSGRARTRSGARPATGALGVGPVSGSRAVTTPSAPTAPTASDDRTVPAPRVGLDDGDANAPRSVSRRPSYSGGSGASIADTTTDLPRAPVWTRPLLALTVLAAAVLIAGVVVYLARRPAGDPGRAPDRAGSALGSAGSGAGPGNSAGTGSAGGSAAIRPPPPTPAAPAGMVLVLDAAGKPAFFVDAAPVPGRDYAAMFASHKVAKGMEAKPVTGVSYVGARSYAQTKGGRLLTSAEYDRALATPGVLPPPAGVFEWIDQGGEPAAGGPVVRAVGKRETRTAKAPKDVTFRSARSVPSAP